MPHDVARLSAGLFLIVAFLSPGIAFGQPPARPAVPEPGIVVPDDWLGVRVAPLLLLSRSDIRSDLGINERQAADAKRAIADFHARAEKLRGMTGAGIVEARKAVDEAQRLWFEAHLSPEQRNRLLQLDLQWEGPSALVTRPIVASSLELSPPQQATLRQAVALRDQSRRHGTYSLADEQALTRSVRAVLSPVQWERWLAMRGNPFVPQIATRPTGVTR